MNNIKKVALIIPSLQAGGMERVMSELANYFSKKADLEVHLVLYGINREIFFNIPENIIIHRPSFKFDSNKRFLQTIKTLFFLRKKIKKINPITILSFGEYWNNFVLLSTLGLNFPIYVSDRSQPDKNIGFIHEKLRSFLYPKSKGVILQTQKAKQIYQTKYNTLNIKVIGNPIRKIDSDSSVQKNDQILMVGRLIESKHQDRLIKIFAKLKADGWKLVLVGYDSLKQKNSEALKKIIRDLNLKDKVILAGKQLDVESYYLKSKIFAFTSSSEGFPNVVGEAMSASLPVVSYDCVAGPSEMIRDTENGYLIPLFDDESFLQKLQQLVDDEKLRSEIGGKAKLSMQNFEINNISNQFLDFIFSHV